MPPTRDPFAGPAFLLSSMYRLETFAFVAPNCFKLQHQGSCLAPRHEFQREKRVGLCHFPFAVSLLTFECFTQHLAGPIFDARQRCQKLDGLAERAMPHFAHERDFVTASFAGVAAPEA